MRRARLAAFFVWTAVVAPVALAQSVSGIAFEDRNGNGVRDAGEPGLSPVPIVLFGTRDVGGATAQSVATDPLGSYSFAPGNGCYVFGPSDPTGWRLGSSSRALTSEGAPGYLFPVGSPRLGKLDQGIAALASGAFKISAMGDSIAYNFNVCNYPETFWYAKRLRERLACAAPAATVTLDPAAVKGQHTDDLLVDDTADHNNVFRAIEQQPNLVTLSMIGNDLLGVDPTGTPTQAQVNTAVAEVLDSRANLQEALSTLTSEIPGADLVLNSLYDNLAYNCNTGNTSIFHRTWLPIVNRILEDLAWGQARRATLLDAAAEFAQEDQLGVCTGFDALICRDIFGFDRIHPTNDGYSVMREKAWEAAGGVNLGPKDILGRTALSADWAYLRKIRRVFPSAAATYSGATVTNPDGAFSDADLDAAAAITLGAGSEEIRLTGFPDWFDEDVIVRTIAGVRYRTLGTVADDFYRMEASVPGTFRPPPGHAYTPTDWNYYTPIVGGGGPNSPPENPDYPTEKTLAVPNVASFRTVTATLSKNPVLAPGAGRYDWPAVHQSDLTTTAIRVLAAPVAATPANDPYTIELDAAWVDLYGWQKPRPAEAGNVRVDRLADGSVEVTFDPVPGAARYNLYSGRLSAFYDHGASAPAGPFCAAATAAAGGGRLKIVLPSASQPAEPAYFLVTAHVDEVESPAGFRTGGVEIDRAQSTCR